MRARNLACLSSAIEDGDFQEGKLYVLYDSLVTCIEVQSPCPFLGRGNRVCVFPPGVQGLLSSPFSL